MRKPKTKRSEATLPRRVIVVEDDAVLGLNLEQALLESGVEEVRICPTAACTMDVLKDDQPDAIILDVHLADSDAGWAIAELIDTIGGKPPRIIFQTGSPDDIPDHVAELGPVLSKPYSTDQLLELLKTPQKRGILARMRGR